MSIWSNIAKMAGGAAKGTWGFAKAGGRSLGNTVIHPAQTLKGAGSAMKTAAVGGVTGYVAWEKLTTDKSVVEIVGDAVVGEKAVDTISEAANDVKELKNKAGEAVDAVNGAIDMFGNFFGNLAKGNVSGLSIAGLVAAAFLTFGRFGWLGKIAGAMLGMMLIGNNSNMQNMLGGNGGQAQQRMNEQPEEQRPSGGMKR